VQIATASVEREVVILTLNYIFCIICLPDRGAGSRSSYVSNLAGERSEVSLVTVEVLLPAPELEEQSLYD